jgi:hypothetical protein
MTDNPLGRPTLYTEELATFICAEIASGEKVSDICKAESMPSQRSVYTWLARYPEFSQQYAKAQADRTHAMAEEIMDIADDGRNDWMERNHGDNVGWVANGEALQRSRLRVDTRKWLMSKMQPKKYGDSLNLGNAGDEPFKVVNEIRRTIVDPKPNAGHPDGTSVQAAPETRKT